MKVAGCLISLALVLAACASQGPMNRSIPLAARERISATDVVISISQRELVIATPSKAWAYRGAVFLGAEGIVLDALVNVSVDAILAARARSSLEPLRSVLVDFSFDETLNADLQARISQANWVNPGGSALSRK